MLAAFSAARFTITRLNSCGYTLTNFGSMEVQFSSTQRALGLFVASKCRYIRVFSACWSSGSKTLQILMSCCTRSFENSPLSSRTYARAARHAGREVAPRFAEHNHRSVRHVLTAMVAEALDDGGRLNTHRKPLTPPRR